MQVLNVKKFSLAPNGVFWSIQGEGHLRGFQMTFVRLAGCSVGCSQCDTDYSVKEKISGDELIKRIESVRPDGDRDRWVWITGGEPTDNDLRPLLGLLKGAGYSTALATSGVRRFVPPVDWLSVSPHSIMPGNFLQRYGNEIKLIDGLNGLNIDDWVKAWPDSETDFMYRYVQPMSVGNKEDLESLERCLGFLRKHPRWSLSRQDHIYWRLS